MLPYILTNQEIDNINKEIVNLSEKFSNHSSREIYKRVGALREGQSIIIKQPHKDFEVECPEIKAIMDRVFDSGDYKEYGRCYIHKLSPGNKIYPHVDNNEPTVENDYFLKIDRFHIYLDIDSKIEIRHGSIHEIKPFNVIQFDHQKMHSYRNNSNKELTFVVFDIYKN